MGGCVEEEVESWKENWQSNGRLCRRRRRGKVERKLAGGSKICIMRSSIILYASQNKL
jgi:hypothetical protein